MQIKNMKSTLNQLMNLLQVETVLQVLLLLYVSNKINLSQVFGSKFFCGGWTTTCWSSGEPRHMSMFGTLLKVLVLFERDTSSEA
jgi:hypothetical protein